jgi:Resolvase, N terminal domain/Helix-turn-helix domain of resolvase
MAIIWPVPWRPGASAGTQITATARTRAATPTILARSSPRAHSFSASTTAASMTMAARFITPTTTNSAISDQQQRVGVPQLQEQVDTTTRGGKLVFHVFAALAEFERDLIRQRTAAGLAAARARGRHGGRPAVLTGHKLQVAQDMYASGQYTVAAIAEALNVSRASIDRHLTGDSR